MNSLTTPESLRKSLHALHGTTAPLNQQVFDIQGLDAQEFLQGQLTMDLSLLDFGQHRLTAWCNAKGRVWTLPRIWRHRDGFRLMVPGDQAEAFGKRLRLFVLRAKVSINPCDLVVQGQIGNIPTAGERTVTDTDDTSLLTHDKTHGLHISPSPVNPQNLTTDHWLALRILAAEPQIRAKTQEKYLPQSLGLEELGGLHFNKGCYVGQEIVARVHYKGRTPQKLSFGLNPTQDALSSKQVLCSAETEAGVLIQWLEHVTAS